VNLREVVGAVVVAVVVVWVVAVGEVVVALPHKAKAMAKGAVRRSQPSTPQLAGLLELSWPLKTRAAYLRNIPVNEESDCNM